MKNLRFLILFITLISFGFLKAQVSVHDEQKFKQWRSMENPENPEDWDFGASWWYYLLHKDYSGAHWKWQWKGFKSGPVIVFNEDDSNRKRMYIERMLHVAEVAEIKNKTRQELDTITPVYNEETARYLERNTDIMYAQYKSEFERMQKIIADAATYCIVKSQGKLVGAVENILNRNDYILNEIAYIHKDITDDIGNEMENTKRQLGYEESLKNMQKLVRKSISLVSYAKSFYGEPPQIKIPSIIPQ